MSCTSQQQRMVFKVSGNQELIDAIGESVLQPRKKMQIRTSMMVVSAAVLAVSLVFGIGIASHRK